ncbi:MAG: YgiQ family radical SAM protein, partial [Lachnospiraceae bacterium]|nr:YgiQ family radical SAM protein [Lachnospiraceae bacterium]
MNNGFLPMKKEELAERGIDRPDFVYISGDAYVDHPSFAHALLCRLLEARGYSVGLICQPDWKDPGSVQVFGEPKLCFLISSGNMDSMVNHYTVSKKRRTKDAYSPGGIMGKRPDHAVIVYSNLVRSIYPHTPIIIGGIEASLRRMGHYDYWSDQVKRSILLDSGADLISYGMGEHSLLEIAEALAAGIAVSDLTYIRGTVFKTRDRGLLMPDAIELPAFERIREDKRAYAESFYIQYSNTDPYVGKQLTECYDNRMYVVQNP